MGQFIVVHVGDRLFALGLDRVRAVHEAVPVAPVPLVPAHVEGLAAVRGDVLLVVNLRRLTGREAAGDGGGREAAGDGGGREAAGDGGRFIIVGGAASGVHAVALRVDRVAGLTTADDLAAPSDGVLEGLALPAGSVVGSLTFKGREVPVLQPEDMDVLGRPEAEDLAPAAPLGLSADAAALPADPRSEEQQAADAAREAGKRRALVVRVAGTDLAIALETVREVFDLKDLRPLPGAVEQVLGLKPLRRRLVLVLSLARLLRLTGPQAASAEAPGKAILVGRPGRRFALAVDAVLGIRTFQAAADMPDVFLDDTGAMVRHLGTDRLEDDRLSALLAPYLDVVQAEDARLDVEETRRFITFDVGATRCALDLGRVRAVMPWRNPDPVPRQHSSALDGQGAVEPQNIDGVVNGGGEVLPVLDLPRWLGEAGEGRRNAYVVADVEGAPWALAVNRLGRVISVPASAVEAVGVRGRVAAFIRRDDVPVWVLGLRSAAIGVPNGALGESAHGAG